MMRIRWFRTSLMIVLSACASPAPGRVPSPAGGDIPPQEDILNTLREKHPRLLIASGDFEGFGRRVADDPVLREWARQLRERADRVLDRPPSRYEIPDGKRLLSTSRRVLDRIYTLAMVYHLSGGEARYRDRAWAELEAAAAFKDWNPSHFLDTAEMTHAFAIGYDWFYRDWSEAQRAVLREAMITHGLRPALHSYRGEERYGWWVRSRHNWNQVCNGGIALGALALGDEEPELCGEILHRGLQSLRRAMSRFAPDGAWAEGPGYWNYATSYNVVHLAALQSALGTDFDFSRYEGFDRTGDFPIYLTAPTGKTFNFADGGARAIRAPQLFRLAERFNRPLYARYQQRRAQPTALDLLWYARWSEEAHAATADDETLDRYFRGPEVVTMRSGWHDHGASFIGFKAGDNKVNHSHLDPGTFVLEALGERWAIDLGGDNYNLPAYFGGRRWTYYRLRAEGHNTLLINPGKGPDQDPRAATAIVETRFTPVRAQAIADLTPAYAQQASSVKRGVALIDDRSRVLIQDEVRANEPIELWWFMHTRATVELSGDGRSAILSLGGKRLEAHLLAPTGGGRFEVREARPLPSSPRPEGQNANRGVRKLAIHLKGVPEARIAVVLTPWRENVRPRDKVTEVTPLAEW
ncbi:MAG: heparinase II/III family protein [Planctomycetota bacterium]|nr:heparinase II/III family protein [Planctomycetota bacterium]